MSIGPLLDRISIAGSTECWRWLGGRTGSGYGVVQREGKRMYVHRLVYERAHAQKLTPEQHLHHRCQNPACVNPRHLMLVDEKEHRAQHILTQARGERNARAKLNDEAVRGIRSRLRDGESVAFVADRFGVDRRTVRDIRDGISWRHVT